MLLLESVEHIGCIISAIDLIRIGEHHFGPRNISLSKSGVESSEIVLHCILREIVHNETFAARSSAFHHLERMSVPQGVNIPIACWRSPRESVVVYMCSNVNTLIISAICINTNEFCLATMLWIDKLSVPNKLFSAIGRVSSLAAVEASGRIFRRYVWTTERPARTASHIERHAMEFCLFACIIINSHPLG